MTITTTIGIIYIPIKIGIIKSTKGDSGMSKFCTKCGLRLENGICPNCTPRQEYTYEKSNIEYHVNQYQDTQAVKATETSQHNKNTNLKIIIPFMVLLVAILASLIILIISIKNIKIPVSNNESYKETIIVNEDGIMVSNTNEDVDRMIKESYIAWINDDTEEFKNMLAECVVDKYYEETNVAKDESKEDEEVTDEEITYNMNSVYCEMEDINLGTIISYEEEYGIDITEAYGAHINCEISRKYTVSYNVTTEDGDEYVETEEKTSYGESYYSVLIVEIEDKYYILDAKESKSY